MIASFAYFFVFRFFSSVTGCAAMRLEISSFIDWKQSGQTSARQLQAERFGCSVTSMEKFRSVSRLSTSVLHRSQKTFTIFNILTQRG